MAMNKNGMKNTGFGQKSASVGSTGTSYNMHAMVQYCKEKGIKIEDLSPSELNMFVIR